MVVFVLYAFWRRNNVDKAFCLFLWARLSALHKLYLLALINETQLHRVSKLESQDPFKVLSTHSTFFVSNSSQRYPQESKMFICKPAWMWKWQCTRKKSSYTTAFVFFTLRGKTFHLQVITWTVSSDVHRLYFIVVVSHLLPCDKTRFGVAFVNF